MDLLHFFSRLKFLRYKIRTIFFYRHFFAKIGKKTKIIKPLELKNTKHISIGSKTTINEGIFLMTQKVGVTDPLLEIGDNCAIGHFAHIVCVRKLTIGNNVLIADRVYVSDNSHIYEDINVPVCEQGINFVGETFIGDNTWVGENACIIGSKIGKNCVIAANSVVISDVPDYCMVAGSPAKIKKFYNNKTMRWEKYGE